MKSGLWPSSRFSWTVNADCHEARAQSVLYRRLNRVPRGRLQPDMPGFELCSRTSCSVFPGTLWHPEVERPRHARGALPRHPAWVLAGTFCSLLLFVTRAAFRIEPLTWWAKLGSNQ